MIYKILIAISVLNIGHFIKPVKPIKPEKPKLVIGIVIDQMKYEYLYRFQDNYTANGFKRLMREGFNVKNIHYNYIPTATAPGHTSIYTGTTPTNHGIVGNYWYSRKLNRNLYCVEDTTAFLVDNIGIVKDLKYKDFSRSPKNIMATTITDELKLFTNNRSKVIGVSLKDRGAICPSGHLADAAYWYNGIDGNFITSTFYKEKLPDWLIVFNNQHKADSLLNSVWMPLLPIEKYINSGNDDAYFEKIFKGKQQSVFPYNLKKLRKENGNYELMIEVPQGNTLLTELVKAAIKGEHLGKGNETDFLTISYSATDYVGHYFGIRSKELEDTYVRMDREIATVLDILDREIGKDNYVLFLTSDHGSSDNPPFIEASRLPGNFFSTKKIKEDLNAYLSKEFGNEEYIAFLDKTQLYINTTKTPKKLVIKKAISFLKTVDGIKEVFAPKLEEWNINNSTISNFIKSSYNLKRSGDILLHFDSGWMESRNYGTNHSTAYTSDTHVPLLWFGWHIPIGESINYYEITQIAPTLSMLLNISLPSSSDRNPIEEIFKKQNK